MIGLWSGCSRGNILLSVLYPISILIVYYYYLIWILLLYPDHALASTTPEIGLMGNLRCRRRKVTDSKPQTSSPLQSTNKRISHSTDSKLKTLNSNRLIPSSDRSDRSDCLDYSDYSASSAVAAGLSVAAVVAAVAFVGFFLVGQVLVGFVLVD